jgi:hypothetical protein
MFYLRGAKRRERLQLLYARAIHGAEFFVKVKYNRDYDCDLFY